VRHIKKLEIMFDVKELRDQLSASPEVWNTIPYRTGFDGSPHREVDDVWVRYNALENFDGDSEAFNASHTSVWYEVVQKIPQAKLLAISLFHELEAQRLGGVLLTRIPPGAQVYPHIDPGWHARYYEKFVIQVDSAPGQKFCFEDGGLEAEPGECYQFDNAFTHWVVNPTKCSRVSLIICLRGPKCHLV
jgi:hypothetical protein